MVLANTTGQYSSSSVAGDTVICTTTRYNLLLQSGTNSATPAAIKIDTTNNVNIVNKLAANGGSYINLQNNQDGASTKGINMSGSTDNKFAIYMARYTSLNNATACSGNEFTAHATRFRMGADTN